MSLKKILLHPYFILIAYFSIGAAILILLVAWVGWISDILREYDTELIFTILFCLITWYVEKESRKEGWIKFEEDNKYRILKKRKANFDEFPFGIKSFFYRCYKIKIERKCNNIQEGWIAVNSCWELVEENWNDVH